MTTTALEKLLASHAGAESDGTHLKLGAPTTFFVRIGSQSMTIDRVVGVNLDGDLTTLTCSRGDVYAVATADVAAIHFEAQKQGAGHRPPPAS